MVLTHKFTMKNQRFCENISNCIIFYVIFIIKSTFITPDPQKIQKYSTKMKKSIKYFLFHMLKTE